MSRDARRSSRIALRIPVEVSGIDDTGAEIQEKASTDIVNRHGASVLLQHRFSGGSEILIRIPHLGCQQKCRVVWSGTEPGEKGYYETGIELEAAENFWGVQFPPEDWEAPLQVPLAGDQPGPSLPQTIVGDSEQQMVTVGAMLHALISVLEEKGIVSPAELAEMLKRRS